MKSVFFVLTIFCAFFLSCNKSKSKSSKMTYPFEFFGLLKQQTITAYQYGSHTISSGDKIFALTSNTIDLDKHIGKKVTIKGTRVEGYPLEDGPELINVKVVQ
jgi:hypothetical protein